jgi:glutamate mutase epsilon subunit
MCEQHQAMRSMHEKMMAQAKAEDATLEKLVAELKKAPEARKPDLEAAILTKLVAAHHQRLNEWESLQASMKQFREERREMTKTGISSNGVMSGQTGQTATTAQK